MSPFEVYLILNANSFRLLFFILVVAFSILSIGYFIASDGWYENKKKREENKRKCYRKSKFYSITSLCLLILGIAIPSSTTLAAMYVVPALTSEKALVKEKEIASDIYHLAKNALQSALEIKEGKDGQH